MSQLDRTGEPLEDMPEPHDPRCRKGWIDRDAEVPVPCLTCRPNLAPHRLREQALGPYIPHEPPGPT